MRQPYCEPSRRHQRAGSPRGHAARRSPSSRQGRICGGSGTSGDTAASWKCVCQSCKGVNRNGEKCVCGELAPLPSALALSLINTLALSSRQRRAPTRDERVCSV